MNALWRWLIDAPDCRFWVVVLHGYLCWFGLYFMRWMFKARRYEKGELLLGEPAPPVQDGRPAGRELEEWDVGEGHVRHK